MVFASLMLPAIAALLVAALAALMLRASCRKPEGPGLREFGLGFAASAIGLAMIVVAALAMIPSLGVLGYAALLFGAGFVWAAAQRIGTGSVPRPTAIAAGAIGWLVIALAVAPPPGWQIAISSAVIAAYGCAAAHALLSRPARIDWAQRRGGVVLAAHGAFWALWVALGPALTPTGSGASLVLGAETALFAMVFGWFALGMLGTGLGAVEAARAPSLEDPLTGVGNGHALFGGGAALLAEAGAAGRPLALLVMDIDGFAGLNQRHGPAAADQLLVAFASLAHAYLPPACLVCRLAEDAFATVMPGADPERARAVADELRALFGHLELDGPDARIRATVSIGIAQSRPGQTGMAELLDAATRCLAAAKHAGRDCVVDEADLAAAALLAAA